MTPNDDFVCLYQGDLLAGVDEVGRGPLAGDVVAAAVILDPKNPIEGLNDSKKLTEKKRERLYDEIKEKALSWSLGRASVAEIDQINILHASLLAMKRAIEGLSVTPEYALIDGNKSPEINIPHETVVKGDSRVAAISAASILAKVTRDREMVEFDNIYPNYGFAGHKGYPTAVHMKALKEQGVTPIHRTSFRPVRECIAMNQNVGLKDLL